MHPGGSLGFLICGNASDNNSVEPFTLTVGIVMLVDAALHIAVKKKDWDEDMIGQLERAAASRVGGRAAGTLRSAQLALAPLLVYLPPADELACA